MTPSPSLSDAAGSPSAAIGFSAIHRGSPEQLANAQDALQRALGYFSDLTQRAIDVGETRLVFWGRGELDRCCHILPDSSILVLIGSPIGDFTWKTVSELISKATPADPFIVPWEGRVILLRIDPASGAWTLWNDWLGSIPVFHANRGRGRIASTLEPVTVSAAGCTPDEFFLPGLVSLLINGHFLSDWTLYKEMKVVPPDSVTEWSESGFRTKQLFTVQPSQSRWETGWNDLVDEMHTLSHRAVADVLKTQPAWILPLSSGLDSRLIAGVAANVGAHAHTYAWGEPNATDVVFSRQIARTLGFPWRHIHLPADFLVKYTPQWADLFGSAMHFHGMYQMSFLDEIKAEPAAPLLSGFVGDVLSGDSIIELTEVHSGSGVSQLQNEWYIHWDVGEIESLMKIPVGDAIAFNAACLKEQLDTLPGIGFQKFFLLELWNRQRFFTNFQSILGAWWRGVATPFMNRAYARFCMSLPRAALDNRRLLADVYRRYYHKLAIIPGTYSSEPFILTGRYLIKRRIAKELPPLLRRGPFAGFEPVPLRMDIESVQSSGRAALWPIDPARDQLSRLLNVDLLDRNYQIVARSREDLRPLRRLQSVQTLAYRLLGNSWQH